MKKIRSFNLTLFAITLIATFFAISCEKDSADPTAPLDPVAEFSYKINSENSLMVTFEATISNVVSIEWSFGDGETSTEENPTHTYAEANTYTVTLTAVGAEGTTPAVITESVSVSVEAPYVGPIDVENGDFELPGDGKHQNWTDIPGWSSDTDATDSGVESGGWMLDSTGFGGFKYNVDPAVYNLTNYVIAGGEWFMLSLDAIDIWNGSKITITLYFDSGDGTRNVLGTQTFDLVAGQWSLVEFAASASSESVGAKIGIEIENVSPDGMDGWIGFDDVKLSVE